MKPDTETYRSMLSPETRLMCDMLSPEFNAGLFDAGKTLPLYNPEKLLKVLIQHRLYPPFYRVWKNTGANWQEPQWLHFSDQLKQWVEKNRVQMLQKTAVLIKLVKAFEAENIPVIALKGPALAQRIYEDVAMRFSWDLDFLVSPGDIENADRISKSMNFKNVFSDIPFTPKQYNFCINNYQHFVYSNPEFTGNIEIHWKLPQLEPFLGNSIPLIYSGNPKIELGGCNVQILDPAPELYYLMAHGAFHSFYRLSWLNDINQILNKAEFAFNDPVYTQNKSLQKLVNTVLSMNQTVFKFPGIMLQASDNKFIMHCFKTILSIKDGKTKPSILREYRGKLLLTANSIFNLKKNYPLLTSPKDWDMLKLPDKLFFLYFVIRPVLFFYRAFSKKGTRKNI